MFLLGMLCVVLCAVVGLATGYLFIPGRGGTPLELYGITARIVSAAILLFFAAIIFWMVRGIKKNKRPKILGDRDHQ